MPLLEKETLDEAAKIGTNKVINDHSTIGIVVTTDGSITEIPREDYIEAEESGQKGQQDDRQKNP